jgi:3-hydroxymyristoyl/3-hydroxydecanoyl-(acyl carrier protein) dehydratase
MSSAAVELQDDLCTPLDHPCYDGHFPGHPILPGVVLLELVVERIGRGAPRAIPALKFQRSLSPGQGFTLRWADAGARVRFRCHAGVEPVAEGVLEFGETG